MTTSGVIIIFSLIFLNWDLASCLKTEHRGQTHAQTQQQGLWLSGLGQVPAQSLSLPIRKRMRWARRRPLQVTITISLLFLEQVCGHSQNSLHPSKVIYPTVAPPRTLWALLG
jgi:hypothetical protein